ncbi:sulfatase [Sphingobacterium sp. HJSM2_6]|uniref:sulfatase family protein n=1 Tax=Sphingobacterium sp. HJSM2_6 TaxID=3366264 RepID=UPI003BC4E235
MNQNKFCSNCSKAIGNLVLITALITSIGFAQTGKSNKHDSNKKPNIILILSDDLGLGDISAYHGKYATPHIDQLAREGIRFTNYYSASPICSPSRAGILTGIQPAKLHFTTFLNTKAENKKKKQVDFLNPELTTIADLLKSKGYATAHFGKWHMGGGRDVLNAPNFDQYGFDEWASTYESPDPDPLLTKTNWIWSDQDSIKRWNRTAYFVDKTLAFLKKNPDKPCYINLWTDDVHTPWVAGDDEVGRYPGKPQDEKSFQAVLQQFDVQIGRLIQGLKELGMDENTIVIFTSDNGPMPNFRQDRSAGFRGSKLSLYEGGIRLPFIVRYPEKIKPGTIDSVSIISALDYLPTFASIAEVASQRLPNHDGQNMKQVWYGKPTKRELPLIWEYGRNDTTAYNLPKNKNKSPAMAIRDKNWKFLMNQDQSGIELYDLSKDREETINLLTRKPDLVKKYQKILLEWWNKLPDFPN